MELSLDEAAGVTRSSLLVSSWSLQMRRRQSRGSCHCISACCQPLMVSLPLVRELYICHGLVCTISSCCFFSWWDFNVSMHSCIPVFPIGPGLKKKKRCKPFYKWKIHIPFSDIWVVMDTWCHFMCPPKRRIIFHSQIRIKSDFPSEPLEAKHHLRRQFLHHTE